MIKTRLKEKQGRLEKAMIQKEHCTGTTPKSLPATMFVVMAYLALMTALVGENLTTLKTGLPYGLSVLFTGYILFQIFNSGEVNRWRNIFFCTYAVALVISFLWEVVVTGRGHMWLMDRETLAAEGPICPIVSVMDLLPMIINGTNVFPTAIENSVFGVIAWVIVTGVVFGRGFCSWACLFGGQDSLFASMRQKVRWRITHLHPFFRYSAFGVLAFIVLLSFSTLTPGYCIWLCPFKATTEFFEINSFLRVLQTFLFFSIWLVLVVLLPLMTKKRTQCGFLCPMGAYFSLTNKISPFYVRINHNSCTQCGRCIDACPTFSMSRSSLVNGKTDTTCTKCGACFAACPQHAISYAIKGVPFTGGDHPLLLNYKPHNTFRQFIADLWEPGTLFVFTIFLLGGLLFTGTFAENITILLTLAGVRL